MKSSWVSAAEGTYWHVIIAMAFSHELYVMWQSFSDIFIHVGTSPPFAKASGFGGAKRKDQSMLFTWHMTSACSDSSRLSVRALLSSPWLSMSCWVPIRPGLFSVSSSLVWFTSTPQESKLQLSIVFYVWLKYSCTVETVEAFWPWMCDALTSSRLLHWWCNFCFCSCEHRCINNFHSVDGGGLPPLPALFSARQS